MLSFRVEEEDCPDAKFHKLMWGLEDEEKELTIHQLTISKPMHKNMGKYTCTCNDIQTGAYLDVEGKFIHFTQAENS